jgi:putative ABC transport system permease protein
MIWKNIIITWRNLLKNKTVSFINIFGLSLGLASSLLAILYAFHELTYEDCYSNSEIASVSGDLGPSGGLQEIEHYGPEREALKNMFPEIEAFTISSEFKGIVKVGDLFDEDRILR